MGVNIFEGTKANRVADALESISGNLRNLVAPDVVAETAMINEAKKWVDGKNLDGTSVPSTAPQYENNAEFFKNQAQQILSSVSTEGATQIAAIEAKGEETLESIPDDYTELSGDVDSLKSSVYGDASSVTPEFAYANIAENGTRYTGGGEPGYNTKYIPIGANQKCAFDVTAAQTGEFRFGFCKHIPENLYAATYLGKINLTANGNGKFEYISSEDGYVSMSYWFNLLSAVTITVYDGGIYDKAENVPALQTEVFGVESEITPGYAELDFAENGTKYRASTNYDTYYWPVVAGGDYSVRMFHKSQTTDFRFAFSTEVPANNVAGSYLIKKSVGGWDLTEQKLTAPSNGYLSVSYYKQNDSSVEVTVADSGLRQRVAAIETEIGKYDSDITEINQEMEQIVESISGAGEAVTPLYVDGLNLEANAVKYNASTYYETYYIPIVKGNDYQIDFNNQNSNHWYVRLGMTTAVPAANVAAIYITQVDVNSKSTGIYSYTATADGYLSLSYYKIASTSLTITEISGGIEQRLNIDEARIAAIEDLGESIENINDEFAEMKGQTIQLESGIYWSATTVGSANESGIQTSASSAGKRTTLTLAANKVLRIMGVGFTDLTRLYWVFRASDGLLIDIADAQDQLTPRSYYLRYDVETHIYINCANAYDHFIGIVDDVSPWVDISKSIGTTTRKIIDFDERNIRYAVQNMKRGSRSTSIVPVLFLHFSDIHGDTENLSRLMEFASDYHIGHYLNDILCTGDVVKATLDDGMTWFDSVSGTDKILLLPGNHDSVKGTASSPTSATKQEMYEALFADRVSEWGVTQPEGASTNYLGYYYKDYATQKLRLICLDANGSGDYQTAEVNWFADVLEEAYDLGYAVVCAEHFGFDPSVCTGVHCTFNSDENIENEGSWTIPSGYISAVETFIGGGGEFICWLGGHVHKDRLTIHNNGHQWFIGVSTASHEGAQTQHEDSNRITGDKSQDSFNIVGIDTYKKRLTILKIGSDLTRMLAHKRYLCLDYANRTVVWNN